MDEDIPLPLDLPAAELNRRSVGCPGFRPLMTALEGWTLVDLTRPDKSRMMHFHPMRPALRPASKVRKGA
jgi:hypothetical protein